MILTLQLPKGHEDGILALLTDLCDHVEKWRDAGSIEDYGLGLVVPQCVIKELPASCYCSFGPDELCPRGAAWLVGDCDLRVCEAPPVRRDARSKALERCDRR